MQIQWAWAGDGAFSPGDDSGESVSQISLAGGSTVTSTDLSSCGGSGLQSPLVLEDSPGAGILTLNPLSTETDFDLTGDGIPERISCVAHGSFLALPNANNQIININQLFGNNTVGPDGKKAANGFQALGKYDSNGDGVIDAADPIFTDLRVWHDTNCDGVAQPGEITTLSERGITAVRFAHPLVMHQFDKWGNETEQRDLLDLNDGGLSRIFDLWFKPY